MTEQVPLSETSTALPRWRRVLAVVAHPDEESFTLGAVIDAFGRAGTTVSVLCLTRGERGVPAGRGTGLRIKELEAATRELGVERVVVLRHPDGDLDVVPRHLLADDVIDEVGATNAEGLLVVDSTGHSGHSDHAAAGSAALLAAAVLDVPVLGWALPAAVAAQLDGEGEPGLAGVSADAVDLTVPVQRDRQLAAVRAHASQAATQEALRQRLELLGEREHLRWLYAAQRSPQSPPLRRPVPARASLPAPAASADEGAVRVVHREGDRFDIRVRQHLLTIDQPEPLGGQDTAPSPTELFVAGVAGCVAFYVRRYLDRHHLLTEGLAVSARYELSRRPARVSHITVEVTVPRGVPEDRYDGLLAVAKHCTLHNTLDDPPEVAVGLVPAP
ncbi:MAG TPA: PIG-L family deacetylase [Nocardioidaceae bacterium]|jgi:LmbE family N-acetylglucosaminyl deacetylase/uncharacterized OsmC-like protein